MKLNSISRLCNFDYFLLKAIVSNDYEANTNEILKYLSKCISLGYDVTDLKSCSKVYLRRRLDYLVLLGILDKVVGRPSIYFVAYRFRTPVSNLVLGYFLIIDELNNKGVKGD